MKRLHEWCWPHEPEGNVIAVVIGTDSGWVPLSYQGAASAVPHRGGTDEAFKAGGIFWTPRS